MGQYLIMGLVLGGSAGLAPGPLLTLVISETLARGTAAGVRVALAPLVSDLPVVVICLAVLAKLSDSDPVLGIISLAGGAVILKMGMSNFSISGTEPELGADEARPLARGVVVNLLSPHPYMFWLTVGGPATARAWEISAGAATGFVAGFYLLLIGSKVALALATARTRSFMTGRVYGIIMKLLGGVLCVLSLMLVREGVMLLGWG